ncbi:MAG: cohesin domain-containing protein [Candidatus Liptonbacteria bacterium]|nr:cohesin domain-containing protein [Candidatus Liptonbacteria bacterium]
MKTRMYTNEERITTNKFASIRGCLFVSIRVFIFVLISVPALAGAAVLTMEPTTGTFVVGSTFSVPIYLNTEGDAINAIEIDAKFPADKLQVISPSTGQSVITLWAEQPSYNNQTGVLSLQGLISSGLTTGKGLVTTIAFRVKAPGDAHIKFLGETKVLKHDGLGTDVLKATQGAIYRLTLPPPLGPIVVSESHPDPYTIYPHGNVFLSWIPEGSSSDGYSYVLSRTPIDIPDDISEGNMRSITYRNLSDGKQYFHIKAYRNGTWGGTSHFGVNIDTRPPAAFPVSVLPENELTEGSSAIIQFGTTDEFSGVDHYEIKVISLEPGYYDPEKTKQIFFVEATSPYILSDLPHRGKYDIIVRAYDNAGNYRDSTAQLRVVVPLFSMVGERGIELNNRVLIPWWLVMLLLTLLVLLLLVFGIETRHIHAKADARLKEKVLPQEIIATKEGLEKKQEQYAKIAQLVLLALMFIPAVTFAPKAFADVVSLEPPVVTVFSRNVANDEIFYVGGFSSVPRTKVILYVQNLTTGETQLEEVEADERGEWFYRHGGFLPAGKYVLWTQAVMGGEQSPPSPQQVLSVNRTALQIGASRISLAFLSVIIALLLLAIVIGQILYILYHRKEARRKHAHWLKEVREAEEAVKQGFAVLKRDIEAELSTIRKIKLTGDLKTEEVGREQKLLEDLSWAEEIIRSEVFDIEKEI